MYLLLPNAVPDFDKALSWGRVDCGRDLQHQLIEYGESAKVSMTVQVEYELVIPVANKEQFVQYLSAAPTLIVQRDETISAFTNSYIDSLRILTNRIRKFNAKFIRDKSGLRLAGILQFVLKMVKYAPIEGRGWQPLPEFLAKKEVIINIQNNDERCFGYALLYFREQVNLPNKNGNFYRASVYKEEMFHHHHHDTLPYPISPN